MTDAQHATWRNFQKCYLLKGKEKAEGRIAHSTEYAENATVQGNIRQGQRNSVREYNTAENDKGPERGLRGQSDCHCSRP